MKIYIPYTQKYNNVDGQYVKMASAIDYPDWLNNMFQRGEPFIVVEHDVHPTPTQLKELEHCSEQWCAYGYDEQDSFSNPNVSVYFGCIKFGKELIAKTKNVWQNMENKTWDLVDVHFHPIARQLFTPHQHYPAVVHSKE